MLHTRVISFLIVTGLLLALPACGGGGGQGLSDATNSLQFVDTSLSAVKSGDRLHHVLALSGGSGGPFVFQVTEGAMPAGLAIDDDSQSIVGTVLEDGDFRFTVQVTDTGREPFLTATGDFRLEVGVGDVTIVDALLDGRGGLIPAGATADNPDYPMLPNVVYNDFTSLVLLCAGGAGPYAIEVVDDPQVPDDGSLPLGMSVAVGSTTLVGSPAQIQPGGFVLTLQVTDSDGTTSAPFTCRWKIVTPQIVLVSDTIPGGVCGSPYDVEISVMDGVPPFDHELVATGLPEGYTSVTDPDEGDVVYDPAGKNPPVVTPLEALTKIDASVYPAEDAPGPNYYSSHPGAPPEGLRLDESSGALAGVPRRVGTFRVHHHTCSTLIPNVLGQHSWNSFTFPVEEAEELVHVPSYLLDPLAGFSDVAPYARIPAAEQDLPYSRTLAATGGVPKDGWTDAPHDSQASYIAGTSVGQEKPGGYDWAIAWDPDEDGGNEPILFMEFLTHVGVLSATVPESLVPQRAQELEFTCLDQQLPTGRRNTAPKTVSFEIGPDTAIITQSTTSFNSNTTDTRPLNDTSMTLKKMTMGNSGVGVSNLNDNCLPGVGEDRIGLPVEAGPGVTLATLLSGNAKLDLLRVSVNPTGWWDDVNGLNPLAARPFQHGSRNSYGWNHGIGYNGATRFDQSSYRYNQQPDCTAVQLPDCRDTSVEHDPATGVYTDGGKLYAFDSATHFGLFIIREDAKVYVPAAFNKSYGESFQSFGDNWSTPYSTSTSQLSLIKIPQMTVSPDGRFAALKLRTRTDYWLYESADVTKILLVSLTGERIPAWGNQVYTIIATGSVSASTGQYQFASSLTLTNGYLYYLVGSGSSQFLSWKDHYIYRYDLTGGAASGALLHSNFNADWTNANGQGMQVPFQAFSQGFTQWGNANPFMISQHAYNAFEASLAPHPFRVNLDGNACAILAGKTTPSTSGPDVMNFHVWVDYDGALHQLSTMPRRHRNAGGRGTHLRSGPNSFPCGSQWGAYNGPTTGFEISDDGLKVAATCNRETSIQGSASYSQNDWGYREDLYAWTSAGSTPWAGSNEINVTGATGYEGISNSPTNARFRTQTWRFGGITFTRAGDGFVFWAGYHNNQPTSTSTYYYEGAYKAKWNVGSLYSYAFSDGSVRNILSSADGGCNKTVGAALTGISFSTSGYQTDGGVIKPEGGFLSKDGNFYYIVNKGALSTSKQANHLLVGVNVRSLATSQAINGHQDGRGFSVSGFPTRRGFYVAGNYEGVKGIGDYMWNENHQHFQHNLMSGYHIADSENGWVYFVSDYQNYGAASTTNWRLGGPTRSTTYGSGYRNAQVFCFNPNVGGSIQAITGDAFGSLTSTTIRAPGHIQVSRDGSRLALVYQTTSSGYTWPYERLIAYDKIQLNGSTGALLPGRTYDQFETSNCRISSSVAFDVTGERIYYARGTSNENTKSLKHGTLGTSGSTHPYSFAPMRYNVLHVGR